MNCQLLPRRAAAPARPAIASSPGLGSTHVRAHAYDAAFVHIARDPSFTTESVSRSRTRRRASTTSRGRRRRALAIVRATVSALRERAEARGARRRAVRGRPARDASRPSRASPWRSAPTGARAARARRRVGQNPRRARLRLARHAELGRRRHRLAGGARGGGRLRVRRPPGVVRDPPPHRDEPLHVPQALRARASPTRGPSTPRSPSAGTRPSTRRARGATASTRDGSRGGPQPRAALPRARRPGGPRRDGPRARTEAVTPAFVAAANAFPLARGVTTRRRTRAGTSRRCCSTCGRAGRTGTSASGRASRSWR